MPGCNGHGTPRHSNADGFLYSQNHRAGALGPAKSERAEEQGDFSPASAFPRPRDQVSTLRAAGRPPALPAEGR